MKAVGVDVSTYQGQNIHWKKVRDDGISFAFLRATVRLEKDDTYLLNYERAGEAGILRGAYHFLYPQYDAKQQAQLFAETLLESELPPVLDVERTGLTEIHVRTFLNEFERIAGRKAMIYTSMSKWHELVGANTPWASEHQLWVAHWTNLPEPLLPQAWQTWTFWQFTSEGRVSGYDGHIDMDYFNGDESALCEYADTILPPTLEERVATLEEKANRLWAIAQEKGWL